MSEKGWFIQFNVKATTKLGDEIYIIGSINELGNWDDNKKIKLNTNEYLYPTWETDFIHFNQNYSKIEYKYKKKDKEGLHWEDLGGMTNRELNLSQYTNGYYIVDDGEFSIKSNQKIMTLEEKKR